MTRLTVRDLPAATRKWGMREALRAWWFELPWKRRPLRALRALLFEPGRGWLRWATGTYQVQEIIDPHLGGPWHTYTCAPPLRRVWAWVRGPLSWLVRAGGWYRDEHGWGWFRLTLEEHRMTWAETHESLTDPEWPWGYL